MSLELSAQVPVSKTCCVCRRDVSTLRRVKDTEGHYYCEPCYKRLAEQRAQEQATSEHVAPEDDLLFCEQCGGRFPHNLLLLDDDGRVLCRMCNDDVIAPRSSTVLDRLRNAFALAHLTPADRYEKLRWRFLVGGVTLHLLLPIVALRIAMSGWLEGPMVVLALIFVLAGAVSLLFGFACFALERGRSPAWCIVGYLCHLGFMLGCVGTAYWIVGALTGAGYLVVNLWPALFVIPMKFFYSLGDHSRGRGKPTVPQFEFVERTMLGTSIALAMVLLVVGFASDGWTPKNRTERPPIAVARADRQDEDADGSARQVADARPVARSRPQETKPPQQPRPAVSYRASVGDVTQEGIYGGDTNPIAPKPQPFVPAPPIARAIPQLSQDQCEAWARKFEDATAKGDMTFLAQSMDTEGMARRAVAGITESADLLANVQTLVDDLLTETGNLSEQVIKNRPCKVLWTRQVKGERTAMVRCLLKGDDVDYIRLTLASDAAGNVRVIDLFELSSGGEWSRIIRTVALPLVVSADPVALRNLTPADREIVNNAPLLGEIFRSSNAKQMSQLPNLISQLPQSLRNDRYISLLNVKATAELGAVAFNAAVQRHQQRFPNDPSLSYATFQHHVRAKDYTKMLEALFTLDEAIGGDPYIAGLKAAAYAGIGNIQQAKRHAQQAVAKEPSLAQSHWILVCVALEEKNYGEVARLLTRLEDDLGETIPDLTEERDFTGFTASAEYRAWIKSRKVKDASLMLDLGDQMKVQLVYIAPGDFVMGSPANEPGHTPGELQHKVVIGQGYYLSISEVTQAQWRAVMGNNPSKIEGDDLPVNNVSWHDAVAFCRKATQQQGRTIRLPTEAEWEYACRAGTTTAFSFGTALNTEFVNCADAADRRATPPTPVKPVAVTSLKPNGWGLYEMHGNVWEWCADRPGDGVNPALDVRDAVKPLRGGSFGDGARACRSANLFAAPATHASNATGFRIVVQVPAEKPRPAPAKR